MYARGFAAGAVSAGVSCFAIYYALLEQRSVPHVEYEEKRIPRITDLSQICKYGIPQRSPDVSIYKGHALCYDQQRRIPHWVAERIERNQLKGEARRQLASFKPDPSVASIFSAGNDDYHKSGWSRGHMAPAGNYKHDQEAMNATFLLSNILPQDADNNAGYWNQLEMFCRQLSAKYDHVYVISGPLFLPVKNYGKENTKKYVSYEVIGAQDVAVPTHLFKVVIAENAGDAKPLLAAFVVPNKPLSLDNLLTAFQVPLEFVESRSGLAMLPSLDRQKSRNLCSVESCDIRLKDFELQSSRKRL